MVGARRMAVPTPDLTTGNRAQDEARPAEHPVLPAEEPPAHRFEPVRSRAVAEGIVAPPRVDPAELVRVDPREPLSEIGPARAPRPKPPKNHGRLFRQVASAAGRFEGEGFTVSVAGIDIVEPDETCKSPAGDQWPCGARARTAFRSFLRGRAVDCAIPEGVAAETFTVSCALGAQDLGSWLVASGWARAAIGSPYATEARLAADAGRGIHGAGPAALPAALTADPPASALPPPPAGSLPEPSAGDGG